MALQVEDFPELTKTVTAAGTAEPLVAKRTWFRGFAIYAKKVGGANTGIVYIGRPDVDKTTKQYIKFRYVGYI